MTDEPKAPDNQDNAPAADIPMDDATQEHIHSFQYLINLLPEGRAMADELDAAGYEFLWATFDNDDVPYILMTDSKKLILNRAHSPAMMAAYFPVAAAQVRQQAKLPQLGVYFSLLTPDLETNDLAPTGDVQIARPEHAFWGMVMMEMVTKGIMTDFAYQLARAGEPGPLQMIEEVMSGCVGTYDAVLNGTATPYLACGDHVFANLENHPLPDDLDARRPAAAAAAAYAWYWIHYTTGQDTFDYVDKQMLASVDENCTARTAPYFNAVASGSVKPQFVSLSREDVLKLGDVYSFNMLDVPGFDDIAGDAYRPLYQGESKAMLGRINRALFFPQMQ